MLDYWLEDLKRMNKRQVCITSLAVFFLIKIIVLILMFHTNHMLKNKVYIIIWKKLKVIINICNFSL